jgi:hypothetical protein
MNTLTAALICIVLFESIMLALVWAMLRQVNAENQRLSEIIDTLATRTAAASADYTITAGLAGDFPVGHPV